MSNDNDDLVDAHPKVKEATERAARALADLGDAILDSADPDWRGEQLGAWVRKGKAVMTFGAIFSPQFELMVKLTTPDGTLELLEVTLPKRKLNG